MTVLFVGDEPSAKNISKDIPFVGTASYKRLLEWIYKMNIDINNFYLCNKDKLRLHPSRSDLIWAECSDVSIELKTENSPIVALGNKASKHLNDLNIPHYKLPHPSGRNPKANPGKNIDKELKTCEDWIKDLIEAENEYI